MPALAAALLGGLLTIMDSLVGRVLVALGMAYATYTGADAGINTLKGYVITSVQGLPAQVLPYVIRMGVGKAISIIFSAYIVALTFKGWANGGRRLVDAWNLRLGLPK